MKCNEQQKKNNYYLNSHTCLHGSEFVIYVMLYIIIGMQAPAVLILSMRPMTYGLLFYNCTIHILI